MTQLAESMAVTAPADRMARRVDRFAERRSELAASTLQTLSELGYARTSLREIAQNSQFSHGVLHYYFRDKIDLIIYSVHHYKTQCITRYDGLVTSAVTAEELRAGFAAAMATTLVDDAPMHRLWYDLRTQSFFEASLRDDVVEMDTSLEAMIWRVVTRYAELANATITVTSPVAYALFDGVFQQSLLNHQCGQDDAPALLRQTVAQVLGGLITR